MKYIGILLAIMIVLTGCGVDKRKITIEKEVGLEECFFIREVHDDESALRMY